MPTGSLDGPKKVYDGVFLTEGVTSSSSSSSKLFKLPAVPGIEDELHAMDVDVHRSVLGMHGRTRTTTEANSCGPGLRNGSICTTQQSAFVRGRVRAATTATFNTYLPSSSLTTSTSTSTNILSTSLSPIASIMSNSDSRPGMNSSLYQLQRPSAEAVASFASLTNADQMAICQFEMDRVEEVAKYFDPKRPITDEILGVTLDPAWSLDELLMMKPPIPNTKAIVASERAHRLARSSSTPNGTAGRNISQQTQQSSTFSHTHAVGLERQASNPAPSQALVGTVQPHQQYTRPTPISDASATSQVGNRADGTQATAATQRTLEQASGQSGTTASTYDRNVTALLVPSGSSARSPITIDDDDETGAFPSPSYSSTPSADMSTASSTSSRTSAERLYTPVQSPITTNGLNESLAHSPASADGRIVAPHPRLMNQAKVDQSRATSVPIPFPMHIPPHMRPGSAQKCLAPSNNLKRRRERPTTTDALTKKVKRAASSLSLRPVGATANECPIVPSMCWGIDFSDASGTQDGAATQGPLPAHPQTTQTTVQPRSWSQQYVAQGSRPPANDPVNPSNPAMAQTAHNQGLTEQQMMQTQVPQVPNGMSGAVANRQVVPMPKSSYSYSYPSAASTPMSPLTHHAHQAHRNYRAHVQQRFAVAYARPGETPTHQLDALSNQPPHQIQNQVQKQQSPILIPPPPPMTQAQGTNQAATGPAHGKAYVYSAQQNASPFQLAHGVYANVDAPSVSVNGAKQSAHKPKGNAKATSKTKQPLPLHNHDAASASSADSHQAHAAGQVAMVGSREAARSDPLSNQQHPQGLVSGSKGMKAGPGAGGAQMAHRQYQ